MAIVRRTGRFQTFAFLAALVTVALLSVYVAVWLQVDRFHIGRSDFTADYVGGELWNQGYHAELYDPALQEGEHARLIAPDVEGNLAFVYPPTAAMLVAPLARLPLDIAYRIAGVTEFVLLLTATGVALAAAPRGRGRLAVGGLGLALPGTLALLLLGQWDGITAIGVGGGYALWRRGHPGAAGAALSIGFALAKPHLGLGIAVFLIGWRQRRMLVGAVAAAAALAVVDFVAVGPDGVAGFVRSVTTDAGAFHLSSLLGFNGATGSWFGDGGTAQLTAAGAGLAALGVCFWLGDRVRGGRLDLEPALAAATMLSLVASPHLLLHDLSVLAPAIAWTAGWAANRDAAATGSPLTTRVVTGIALLGLLEVVDLGNQSPAPPGRLVPVGLTAVAFALTRSAPAGREDGAAAG